MRYLRATFKGYIGFYSGLGLETVDIDFSKSTHNIVLITGMNGCGKSTLINALNIFPDSSSQFIPGKDAEKHLVLTDRTNIYDIRIISQADDKGGRKTTKAFISKNGSELNENGNVSSYKDIIDTEFELDSNYNSLSSLSSTDRGLGDKTPAERKKFASNIIDNLDIYNNMYKNLNKKSLIYKSHINTLHTKIQNIGRKEDIESFLNNLKIKESNISNSIVNLNNMIVTIQAKTSMDESELLEVQEANQKIEELSNLLSGLQSIIDGFINKTHIKPTDIQKRYEDDKSLLDKYRNDLEVVKAQWKDRYSRLNSINESIQTIRTENIGFDMNDDIGQKYSDSNNKIKEIQKILSKSPTNNPDDIYTLNKMVDLCIKLIAMIDEFYDNIDIDCAIKIIMYGPEYRKILTNKISAKETEFNKLSAEVSDIQDKIRILAILENRPNKCKIDTCPFISDALKMKKSIKGNIGSELAKKQQKMIQLSKDLDEDQNNLAFYDSMLPKYMKLDSIRRLISENSQLIERFYPKFISNFEKRLSELNPFNEIRDHQSLIDLINNLKIYQDELDRNKLLEVEYKAYQEKIQILNSNRTMMEKLEQEQTQVNDEIVKLKAEIDNYQSLIDNLQSIITIESEYVSTLSRMEEPQKQLDRYTEIVNNSKKKSAKAMESLEKIQELKTEIDKYTAEMQPISEQINLYAGQLTLLESYYQEYNEYKRSYDIIETIKKYCSPTAGGIQTLFMQLYMSKTLELSNKVLGMLFGGEYKLLDFVINENEFRIPFIGSGLPVDDISSGSSSQISIMGMVINLVLLHQASTKFNIARLDEIDAGLDNKNRSDFINFIFYAMNILEIEQVFMISHSIEADNSNADIIKLKGYDDYESGIKSGNIIYDYNEHI